MVSQERLSVTFENLAEAFRLSFWAVLGVGGVVLSLYVFVLAIWLAVWTVASLALLIEEAILGWPGYITRGHAFAHYTVLSVIVVFPLFFMLINYLERLEQRGVSVAWGLVCLPGTLWCALFPLLLGGFLIPQPMPPLMDQLMAFVNCNWHGHGCADPGDLRPPWGIHRF